MIISHKHKFIFLKTNKTAGTSIELALRQHCGGEDIITRVTPTDESKSRELGGRSAQHCLVPLSHYSQGDWINLLKGKPRRFYNHIRAAEVRELIGEDIWQSYYKFCFERNPWDKVISLYFWRCRQEPRPSLDEFIENEAAAAINLRSWQVYTINDEIAVDKVYQFEQMDEAMADLSERFGLPELSLPNAKGSFRKTKNYREMFSEPLKKRVGELFSKQVSLFNYQF
ncbi:sulfotransferase family 2 domain-containing protein [Corallincola platygyrae]|uniref:Sulfotransferase family 2 domain-containing protein n=1 Tax=Corallincola platygyrae TaxID=1193278 RepID=A0ABW4XSB6_9GAMM